MDDNQDYRELPAWLKAMDLGVHVHKVVSLWPEEGRDVLTEDTVRSCMYVAVNIKMGHD